MSGNTGNVEIRTQLSKNFTKMHLARPGDMIHLVPSDEHFGSVDSTTGEMGDEPINPPDCYDHIYNEVYMVEEVQHHVNDSGFWTMNLDIKLFPDELLPPNVQIDTTFKFRNPRSGETVSEEQVYGGDLLEESF